MKLQYTIEIEASNANVPIEALPKLRSELSNELSKAIDFYLENAMLDNDFYTLSEIDADLYNVSIT